MLWVSGDLPWYVRASIASFIRQGHEVFLWSYDVLNDLPVRCKLMPADDIISRVCIFGYRDGPMAGHLSGFADWFRYELLRRQGGWWSDSDMLCVKPFEAGDRPYVFASVWEPATPLYVNNNVIYVRDPGSEIMTTCARVAGDLGANALHAEAGPVLLHRMVHALGLDQYVLPPSAFNPIQYRDVALLFQSPAIVRLKALNRLVRRLRPIYLGHRVQGLHLFSAMIERSANVRTADDVPPSSIVGRLLAQINADARS